MEATPQAAASAAPAAATASWIRSYEPGLWVRALPILDAVGAAKLLFIAGWIAAASLLLVLHFYPLEPKRFRNVGPWSQLAAVCCATTVLLMLIVLAGTQTGGLRAAADEVWDAHALTLRTGELAQDLNSSCAAVRRELALISVDCPTSVRARLEGSLKALQTKLDDFAADSVSLSGAVAALPAALNNVGSVAGSAVFGFGAYFGCSTLLLSVATAAVWAAAADAHFNKGTCLRRLGQYSQYEALILEILCAAACVATAMAASAEITLGASAAGVCNRRSNGTLDLVSQHFGENSSAYSAARFYVAGIGNYSALASLSHAQGIVSISHDWFDKYKWAIQKYCPKWSAKSVNSELRSLQERLNHTQELLAPERLYAHYDAAVHRDLCDSFLPALGFLTVLQVPVALLLLPTLAVTASNFINNADAPVYSRLHQEDENEDANGDQDGQIHPAYYVVYAFSVVIFIVGSFMYFLPSTSIIRRITGTLLFASGVFLMMNSDLIVTYLRLHHQLERTKRSNGEFEKNLKDQGSMIQDLNKAAQGFETINKQFGGNVKTAMREVDNLALTIETDLRVVLKDLLGLYSDRSTPHFISSGHELDTTFDLIRSVFSDVISQYENREHKLRNALESCRRFKEDNGVEERVLAEVMSRALTKGTEDIDRIGGDTEKVLKRCAQRKDLGIGTAPVQPPGPGSAAPGAASVQAPGSAALGGAPLAKPPVNAAPGGADLVPFPVIAAPGAAAGAVPVKPLGTGQAAPIG